MKEYTDILDQSFKGLAQQFIHFFEGQETRTVVISNDGHMKSYIRKYKELIFPYFALQFTAVNLDREGLAAKTLQQQGALGGTTPEGDTYLKYHFLPVVATTRVIFAAQDQADMFRFIQAWLMAGQNNSMRFSLESTAFSVPVTTVLEESLSVPPLENEDIGPIFILETSLQLKTFIGMVKTAGVVRSARATFADGLDSPLKSGGPP